MSASGTAAAFAVAVPDPTVVSKWTPKQVGAFLCAKNEHYMKLAEILEREAVDGHMLVTESMDDLLKEAGLSAIHINRIKKEIAALATSASTFALVHCGLTLLFTHMDRLFEE
jgi:hypothetical protein